MKKLASWWKRNPAVRMAARSVAVAVGAYAADAIKTGKPLTLGTLAAAAGAAAIYAAIGLLTPVEPHVGPARAKVHIPPEPGLVPKTPRGR